MKRYIDVDKFIVELYQEYKGQMNEKAIMPSGLKDWLIDRSISIPKEPAEYRPTPEEVDVWSKQLDDLHAKGDLDSTIKELAVICTHYEAHHIDHLQTKCYRRALDFLVTLEKLTT